METTDNVESVLKPFDPAMVVKCGEEKFGLYLDLS